MVPAFRLEQVLELLHQRESAEELGPESGELEESKVDASPLPGRRRRRFARTSLAVAIFFSPVPHW
jgi:hypothetical protein